MSKKWKGFHEAWQRFFGPSPDDVIGQFSLSNSLERKQLLQEVLGRFEFVGIPDEWDEEYMKLHLFLDGVLCITDTEVGVIPLKCGTTGYNFYDRPTTCVLANVVLGNFQRTIGIDCALLHLNYDYHGVSELLNMYAYLLANCDGSVAVNLMNTRVAFIAEADTKAQAESMEKMYTQISEGKPAVYVKTGMGSNFQYLNPKQSYIADQVMDLKQKIRCEFLTRLGIANVNMEKKERLTNDEIAVGNSVADYDIQIWLDNVNAGLRVANELYGLNVTFRKKVTESAITDESIPVGQNDNGRDTSSGGD